MRERDHKAKWGFLTVIPKKKLHSWWRSEWVGCGNMLYQFNVQPYSKIRLILIWKLLFKKNKKNKLFHVHVKHEDVACEFSFSHHTHSTSQLHTSLRDFFFKVCFPPPSQTKWHSQLNLLCQGLLNTQAWDAQAWGETRTYHQIIHWVPVEFRWLL